MRSSSRQEPLPEENGKRSARKDSDVRFAITLRRGQNL